MIGRQEEKEEYLEIDLLVDHVISAIVIQGRFANGLGQEYAEYFMLQYWREGLEDFVEYGEDGEDQKDKEDKVDGVNRELFVLAANTNTYDAVEHEIEGSTVIASKIRILPFSLHPRTVCLRAELKGCRYVGRTTDMVNENLTGLGSSTSPQKAGDDDWGESMFLGAAVGILVTMVLAAVSAIVLVLVRNTRQKKSLSELAHYNSLNSGTTSSIQSSLSTKHTMEFGQPDLVRVETNYNKNRVNKEFFEHAVRNQGKEIVDQEQKEPSPAHLSLPSLTGSSRPVSPPPSSSTPAATFVHSKVTAWLPHKTAIIKQNYNISDTGRNIQRL